MSSMETLLTEIDSFERHIDRRRFLQYTALLVAVPSIELDSSDREFLRRMAGTIIPARAIEETGIDIVANIEHLLARGSAEHRAKILRLLAWSRRVAFLYGGERVAIRARTSRFVLMQKMAKALSAICLLAFWGDDRAMALIAAPEEVR